jgi:hypothetical protein
VAHAGNLRIALQMAEARVEPQRHPMRWMLATTIQTKALVNTLNDLGSLHTVTGAGSEAAQYYGRARDLARLLHDELREGVILRVRWERVAK